MSGTSTSIQTDRQSQIAAASASLRAPDERIHVSALARFGKRVQQRRGEAVSEIDYRPRNLAAVLDRRAYRAARENA